MPSNPNINFLNRVSPDANARSRFGSVAANNAWQNSEFLNRLQLELFKRDAMQNLFTSGNSGNNNTSLFGARTAFPTQQSSSLPFSTFEFGVSRAASYHGKTIHGTTNDNETVEGIIESATYNNRRGTTSISVGGKTYSLTDFASISFINPK